VSPDQSADENLEVIGLPGSPEGDTEDDGGAEFQIDEEFRRTLLGARRMPRRDRRQALRAAFEHRQSALKALHEKRLYERQARYDHPLRLRMLRVPRL
jgi:hypothetical protein